VLTDSFGRLTADGQIRNCLFARDESAADSTLVIEAGSQLRPSTR
jgi:molybdenum cofactor biosynthesis enzyme MoaA